MERIMYGERMLVVHTSEYKGKNEDCQMLNVGCRLAFSWERGKER